MQLLLSLGNGEKHSRINDLGVNTMDEKEVKPVDTRQQLFEFMLEMPEIYGYEQDHLTHAERQALAHAPEDTED